MTPDPRGSEDAIRSVRAPRGQAIPGAQPQANARGLERDAAAPNPYHVERQNAVTHRVSMWLALKTGGPPGCQARPGDAQWPAVQKSCDAAISTLRGEAGRNKAGGRFAPVDTAVEISQATWAHHHSCRYPRAPNCIRPSSFLDAESGFCRAA